MITTSRSPWRSASARTNVVVGGAVGGVEGDDVDVQPGPGSARRATTSSGRRAASTTVRVEVDSSSDTMARPMSLVPPSSTMVCGSPSAFSMFGLRFSRRAAEPPALVADPDAGRVDRRRGPPATRPAAGSPGGSPPGSCGRPWPGSGDHRRRAPRRRGRAAARRVRALPAGRSSASVQPGMGKLSGPWLAAPKRFSTARKLAVPEPASRSTTVRSAASGAERHDELVLQEAAAAVQAVPRADHVERVEVGRDRHDLRRRGGAAPCGTRAR